MERRGRVWLAGEEGAGQCVDPEVVRKGTASERAVERGREGEESKRREYREDLGYKVDGTAQR